MAPTVPPTTKMHLPIPTGNRKQPGVPSWTERETTTLVTASTAQKLVNLLNFGVLLFVLFAEPVHCGMLVGMCRVVVRVRAFHFDGFL